MLPKVEERLAASADGAPLDANERAFVESLLLHRAQQNARAAAIERDMVFARGAALAREINTLESQIREQSAERARVAAAPLGVDGAAPSAPAATAPTFGGAP
jgi:hypothetical protein